VLNEFAGIVARITVTEGDVIQEGDPIALIE
jgi:acetyl-CoA carboxylase biotin carboxyl carrier protein